MLISFRAYLCACILPRASLTSAHSRLRRSWPHLIPKRQRAFGALNGAYRRVYSETLSLLAVFDSDLASARRLAFCAPEGRIALIGASNRRRVVLSRNDVSIMIQNLIPYLFFCPETMTLFPSGGAAATSHRPIPRRERKLL